MPRDWRKIPSTERVLIYLKEEYRLMDDLWLCSSREMGQQFKKISRIKEDTKSFMKEIIGFDGEPLYLIYIKENLSDDDYVRLLSNLILKYGCDKTIRQIIDPSNNDNLPPITKYIVNMLCGAEVF